MPRTKKPKRSEAQRRADEKYAGKNRKNQKENFKNIAATFKRTEAEQIAAIFSAHNVTPAQVLRGAAAALMNGETIRTESEPLPKGSTDTDEPPTT